MENFASYKEKRMFFAANFNVSHLGKVHICHRCFSCYAMENEMEEIQTAKELANRRVASVYEEFDQAGIKFNKVFFE